MSEKVNFSIIIPTYNRSSSILRSIQSVLSQKYTGGFEIIVVDDGSTDNTVDLIKTLNSQFISIVLLEKNSGPNIARNRGAEVSKYDWLIFLDSDDKLMMNSLNTISNLVKSKSFKLLFVEAIDENNISRSTYKDYSGYISYPEKFISKLKNGTPIKGDNLPCVNRKIFLDNKFYENIIGGPGLTWNKIIKNHLFYKSSEICLVVSTNNNDRMSNLTISNLKRVRSIRMFDLKINIMDYLKYKPTLFFINLMKIPYYTFQILIK
jgi:glycosyltransferase involved in cell wall biosynthesis